MANKPRYDALVIPTGEPRISDIKKKRLSFPVSREAIRKFNKGDYGCIFITGGYNGFATKHERDGISEAKQTYDYILEHGIKPENVYYDGQSFESLGKITFPIVSPMHGNPGFRDFENMEILAYAAKVEMLKDYAKVIMPEECERGRIGFDYFPGYHIPGDIERIYHEGLMKAIGKRRGAEEVHDFLINNHPFNSDGWFDKPVLQRKAIMVWKFGRGKEIK